MRGFPTFCIAAVVCASAAAQGELVALQGVQVLALKEIHVADVAEAGDFAFAIVPVAIELE
jgi:hypothetical protein